MSNGVTYKQCMPLGDYLLTDRGLVYELDTREMVPLIPDNVSKHEYNFKLLTDDTVYLETKNKTIRLWRRYTPEDIIKMYNSKQAKVFNDYAEPVEDLTPGVAVQQNDNTPITDEFKRPYVIVNDVAYKNSRAAAKVTGEHHTTVYRKCQLNKDGYYLIE